MTKPHFSKIPGRLLPNVFAQMDQKVAAAVAAGVDVIDLAKGNPDAYPAQFIREAACEAVDDPANARYTPFDGKMGFLEAAGNWYRSVYGVDLDPATEIFAVEGAVDGLAVLFSILLDSGDTVAFADPYYPSYHCMASLVGAHELLLPAERSLGFLPDLDKVPGSVWDTVSVLVLNYPNNPTGAQAPLSFYERAVSLAHEHGFVIIQDFAYAGLGVHEQQPSILEVPGAREVCVEVNSLSKMYAMAGWRAGFLAGNAEVMSVAKQYHYQMGSMITSFVQDAGIVALNSDQSCVRAEAAKYARRREVFSSGLRELGYDVFDSQGGLYAWVHAPKGMSGEDFADALLSQVGVAALPGSCFGAVGSDYVRFSLVKSEEELAEAVQRMANMR